MLRKRLLNWRRICIVVFMPSLHNINPSSLWLGSEFINSRLVRFVFDQFFLARKITNVTLGSTLYLLHNSAGSKLNCCLVLSLPALSWKLHGTAHVPKQFNIDLEHVHVIVAFADGVEDIVSPCQRTSLRLTKSRNKVTSLRNVQNCG